MSSAESSQHTGAVTVIGAGMAGLTCARLLHQAGLTVRVLEAADEVGGRIRTDIVDGFRLDRGFQVLLTSYPEVRTLIDMQMLQPRAFEPGAVVRFGGRFHRVTDPFRQPAHALSTLLAPIGNLGDKLRIALLRKRCRAGTIHDQLRSDDHRTLDLLARSKFGPSLIERFFRPFLGGVFLDADLATSSRMFRFVFRMFSEGEAILPRMGMGEIPRQLQAALPVGSIRTGAAVRELQTGSIVLEGGEVVSARSIVVATDGGTASKWLPEVRPPEWRGVTCLYFTAGHAPIKDPCLILNGEGRGPINNLCFPTQISRDYGPRGRELVSVSVLGTPGDADGLRAAVVRQLVEWFGDEAKDWQHLRTYAIPQALPAQKPGWLDPPERTMRVRPGVYVAGDHLNTASTNGAMESGRRAAQLLLKDLQAGRTGS